MKYVKPMMCFQIVSYSIILIKFIAQWKTIYDQFGDKVLRAGLQDFEGMAQGCYVYQQNCYQIFDNYFLKNNPFFDICDRTGTEVEGSLFGSAFGGVFEPKLPPMPTIEVQVPTTLKEFYNGCVKTVSFQKQTLALDGKSISQTVCNKQIEIKAGMDHFNNVSYRGEGHQQAGRKASNLFINFIATGPNPASSDFAVTSCYSRKLNNLFYKKRITLQEALRCTPVKIPLLDGRSCILSIDQVITPTTIKKIEGEGMIIFDKRDYVGNTDKRGDLYVSFEIVFPAHITADQKARIQELLMN